MSGENKTGIGEVNMAYSAEAQDLVANRPALSVIVTIVSGRESLRRCLEALVPQIEAAHVEILVPYDSWSVGVAELNSEFPDVRFHRIPEDAPASAPGIVHRLYDRRRAVGLALARGHIVALTEDHTIPASDWCERILEAHQRPFDAIGGAIENRVDRPLNWAWYYCDFGRYGRPLPETDVRYASDVNVSYKREALDRVRDVWRDTYQETTVHWTLQERGGTIALDPRPVVYQHRPPMSFARALAERVQWARVFAETRVARVGSGKRLLYAFLTPLLPALLSVRALSHMLRQRRNARQVLKAMPLVLGFVVCWSLGELIGYLTGVPSCHETTCAFKPSERQGLV